MSVRLDPRGKNRYIGASVDDRRGERRFPVAERKSALSRAPERPALQALLEHARTVVLTDEQLKEQRASFVYGNAPTHSRITKESARKAVDSVRVVEPV